MVLAPLDKTRSAGLVGGGEDILEKVDCEDTRRSGGPSQCKAGEQSEPVGPKAPPPNQGVPKGRFYAAKSFAIGSIYNGGSCEQAGFE